MTGIENFLISDIVNPATLPGAIFYALVFSALAVMASTTVRRLVRRVMGKDHRPSADQTVIMFLSQFAQVACFIVAAILYCHLIPTLRSLGTAILTTASVASIVLGLAAQNTLGNLIAGVSLILYQPIRLGDKVRVNAPTGQETAIVESISLGYTVLIGSSDQRIIIPNSVMASSVIVNLGKSGST
jgi:small-conductance mechanosensitive channel